MSNIKITQYLHRPNTTELGMGNTHETYMLISTDTDLSGIFPPTMDVKVRDLASSKQYTLKSSWGREFRVNQMGELYRDYDVKPGDEIVITKIENESAEDISVNIRQFPRVVLIIGSNGAEIVNLERLETFLVSRRSYELKIRDRGTQSTLSIFFREAKKKRNDSPSATDYYSVKINGQDLTNGTYYLTLGEVSALAMLPKSEFNTIELGDNVLSTLHANNTHTSHTKSIDSLYYPYLTALRTKPFMLLAGISGTGKSRIVRKLAQATTTQPYANEYDRWSDNRPENFELIQVKPNWHNSMDVVGFYSNISKKYEFTPFVEFIVKAWQHEDTPYFLCLDEMNLAPVEEYFAEFLSAIESRSTDENGNYVTDPIIKPFKDFGKNDHGEDIGKNMLKHLFGEADPIDKNPLAIQFYEKGLTLPPNLMVMGTVNMDETTFTFSRKVLDRAMSVEMNEVDYDKFLSGETEQFPLLTDFNELLVDRPQKASEVKDDIDGEKVMAYLKDVNALLEDTPFKLGYRASNEAMLYVAANKVLAGEQFSMTSALDDFTLMKILSRIEGDDQRLGIDEDDPRIAAAHTTADNEGQRPNLLTCLRGIVRNHIGNDTLTEKKIGSMCRTLEREHFVSYWG